MKAVPSLKVSCSSFQSLMTIQAVRCNLEDSVMQKTRIYLQNLILKIIFSDKLGIVFSINFHLSYTSFVKIFKSNNTSYILYKHNE